MAGIKKQSFLKGTAVLVAANFLVKVIGAVFKIPLAHILEEEGMALFSSAYNFYAILFVIATAGLPVAVSKMVSESSAKGNEPEARKIFRAALYLLTVIGLIGSCILFFCANLLAKSVGSENSALGIMAIAPAIFFVAVMSAFRGYFQGRSSMTPTALSEVSEALGKLVIGLLLASLLLHKGLINSAAGAVLGVTAGSFLGFITIFIIYFIDKKRIHRATLPIPQPVRSMRKILAELAVIAIPITLGAAVSSLTNLIDLFMIRQRLGTLIVTPDFAVTLKEYFALAEQEVKIGAQLSNKAAEVIYGAYSGYAVPMFNLPLTIVTALSMCLVPAISGSFALKAMNKVRSLTETSVRLTTLFALPCAAGLSALAEPILIVVYNNARAHSMLAILGWAVVFVCLVSVTTAILQASGRVMIPVINMGIGAIVKIISGFFLLATPGINIGGAPISTVICYFTISMLNLIAIAKIIKPKFSLMGNLIKPIVAALIMIPVSRYSFAVISRFMGAPAINGRLSFLPQNVPVTPLESALLIKTAIALFGAIAIAAAVYFILLCVIKAITKDDISAITKRD